MVTLLRRLELDPAARKDAERDYMALADRIADHLDIPRHSVNVIPQGSMRTQTTIRPPGRTNFDLDVVVVLSGPRYSNPDPELFFEEFGEALEGNEGLTGVPAAKNRCWRLPFPNKPYYFDVTPAVPDQTHAYGAALRVRDPETAWSPSNPTEFAQWFCDRADLQFSFQSATGLGGLIEARKSVEPLPSDPVRIDDILRRTIQLVKLHRDNVYFHESDERKTGLPDLRHHRHFGRSRLREYLADTSQFVYVAYRGCSCRNRGDAELDRMRRQAGNYFVPKPSTQDRKLRREMEYGSGASSERVLSLASASSRTTLKPS